MPEHIEIDLWEDNSGGLHFYPGGTSEVYFFANTPYATFLEDCDDWMETRGQFWQPDNIYPIEEMAQMIAQGTISTIATWRSDSPDIVQVHGTSLVASSMPGKNGCEYLGLTEEEMVDVQAKPPIFLRRPKEKGAE